MERSHAACHTGFLQLVPSASLHAEVQTSFKPPEDAQNAHVFVRPKLTTGQHVPLEVTGRFKKSGSARARNARCHRRMLAVCTCRTRLADYGPCMQTHHCLSARYDAFGCRWSTVDGVTGSSGPRAASPVMAEPKSGPPKRCGCDMNINEHK